METNNKGKLMGGVLQVKQKQMLKPHYLRIVLEGQELANFRNAIAGDNNKIIIPKNKSMAVQLPDGPSGSVGNGNADYYIRTYTMRSLDLKKGEMAIDFVLHGDEGPASAWAMGAQVGDPLGVMMKDRGKTLLKQADHYVLAGDHTALPVIAVMLESMHPAAKGTAFIEVFGDADVLELLKPEGLNIVWLFNDHPGQNSGLPGAIKSIEFPVSLQSFVFAAAEAKALQDIQHYLRNLPVLSREDWQAYSYWKHGEPEEASSGERRELSSSH